MDDAEVSVPTPSVRVMTLTSSQQAWLDQDDRRVTMTIRKHGCHITYVEGSAPAYPGGQGRTTFAYSTGFFGLGHPEVLILGVTPETALGVINDLFAQVREGRDLVPGELVTFESCVHRITVEEVPNPVEIAFATQRHYGKAPFDPVPLLQLTYDDKGGRFPWEAGYCVAPWLQPRPGDFRA